MWIFKMFSTPCQIALEFGTIIKVGPLQPCKIDKLHPKEIDYTCKLKIFNEMQVQLTLVNLGF